MSIPSSIEHFLQDHDVKYDVVNHAVAYTSLGAARAAQVEPREMVKAVLLEDDKGYVVVVVLATCHLKLGEIRRQTGRPLALATEGEVRERFPDCDAGAVPVLAPAYGIETIWDESLLEHPRVFFDAGDHERLLCMDSRDLVELLGGSLYRRIAQLFVH